MTREQDATMERIAEMFGRVHVRTGYTDRYVEMTVPTGACWRVLENGVAREAKPDFSIDWHREMFDAAA
jgi:hypothetical protein